MTNISEDKPSTARKSADALRDSLKNCKICPRRCGVDRTKGKLGYCRAPFNPVVYSYLAHRGEEPPLSGSKGSGTIFFTYCNMKCIYCQNYYFSQLDNGDEITIDRLADIMLYLQKTGCHNINLVSPTHYVPQIVMALGIAIPKGLNIPIVYNSGGYDSVDTIRAIEGLIDIYMPDMRYSRLEAARKYSDAPNYVEHNRTCVIEMQRQVGDLVTDEKGIAKKGLIIRLIVLPEGVSGTLKTLEFIKERVSKNAYLSIMSQYYPTFKAYDYKEISRGVTREEYENIIDEAEKLGLNKGWIQEAPAELDARYLGTNIKPKSDV